MVCMVPTRSSKSVRTIFADVGSWRAYSCFLCLYACNKMPDYGRLGYNRRTFRITMMHTIPIRLKHTTRLEMKIVITEMSWSVSRHKIHRICQDHSAGAQENE